MVIDSSNRPSWDSTPSKTTTTPSGGTYTDKYGNPVSRESSSSIDKPGEATAKLVGVGGGASTTQIEQRMGGEDVAKKQIATGLMTAEEVVGAKRMLESKTTQYATDEPVRDYTKRRGIPAGIQVYVPSGNARQQLYEQTIYREPTTKPATEYVPDVTQELNKIKGVIETREQTTSKYFNVPKMGYYPSQKGSPAYNNDIQTSNDWYDKQTAFVKAASLITSSTIDIRVGGAYLGTKIFGTQESEKGYKSDVYDVLNIKGAKTQSTQARSIEAVTKIGTGTTAIAAVSMAGLSAGMAALTGTARALSVSEKAIAIGTKGADLLFKGAIGYELGSKVIQGKPGTALAEAGLIGITLPVGAIGTKAIDIIGHVKIPTIKTPSLFRESEPINKLYSKEPLYRSEILKSVGSKGNILFRPSEPFSLKTPEIVTREMIVSYVTGKAPGILFSPSSSKAGKISIHSPEERTNLIRTEIVKQIHGTKVITLFEGRRTPISKFSFLPKTKQGEILRKELIKSIEPKTSNLKRFLKSEKGMVDLADVLRARWTKREIETLDVISKKSEFGTVQIQKLQLKKMIEPLLEEVKYEGTNFGKFGYKTKSKTPSNKQTYGLKPLIALKPLLELNIGNTHVSKQINSIISGQKIGHIQTPVIRSLDLLSNRDLMGMASIQGKIQTNIQSQLHISELKPPQKTRQRTQQNTSRTSVESLLKPKKILIPKIKTPKTPLDVGSIKWLNNLKHMKIINPFITIKDI